MKQDHAPAILLLLLYLVPELPQLIRRGDMHPAIYNTILRVIEDYGSDDQREWSDLVQVIRQEIARLAVPT